MRCRAVVSCVCVVMVLCCVGGGLAWSGVMRCVSYYSGLSGVVRCVVVSCSVPERCASSVEV